MLDTLSKSAYSFQRRQHLALPGDRMDAVHRVEEGWLARYTRLPSGHRQITGIYLPGDYCEPQWIIDPVSAEWIMALTPARTVALPLKFIELHAGINLDESRFILSDLIRLIARQSRLVIALGRKSGIERLASVLLELHDRLFAVGLRGAQLSMPLTQGDLSDIVGLTPIHINRILKGLRERRILKVNRGSISVLDPEMLKLVSLNRDLGNSSRI